MALDRKTATCGVIGLRTDGKIRLVTASASLLMVPKATVNEMASEESFQHISVLQEINQLGPLFLLPLRNSH